MNANSSIIQIFYNDVFVLCTIKNVIYVENNENDSLIN